MADTAQGAPWQDKDGQWHQTYKSATSGGALYSNIIQDPNAPKTPATGTGTTTPTTSTTTTGTAAKIVPGTPTKPGDVNAIDYAGQLAVDPSLALTDDMKLSNKVPDINENATATNISKNNAYATGAPNQFNAATQTAGAAETASAVDPREAATYTAEQTAAKVAADGQATAQTGTMNLDAQITAPQIDMKGTATGVNEDGSINYTGQALNEYARQGMEVVDTSTPEGKARAVELGEGNYTDSQATLKGQLAKLQQDFVGPNGEPKIPVYAAETARNVSRIAAFKGMTGTAATAAMSQALHEASITVATQDASFFQTLTLQNLNNKQAQTINKANVLAKMDQVNVDNRMAAAIENSKKFMELDMKNLDNKQQTEIINTQNRVQSILEDAKAVNAQRLFTADSQNDMGKYYDGLNASIDQYNAGQQNNMKQFNTDQVNAQARFNSELENNRQQFYGTMQYNIDVANAKWRQTVTLAETDMKFQAAATDVKNLVGISQEALNQIWDRSDALLDYMFKAGQNDKDRQVILTGQKLTAETADNAGAGELFGTLAGSFLSSDTGGKLLDKLFF